MGLLRHQVEALTKTRTPTYCARIEQISFNAWHYADSNLWASLGDEIFRQLAGQGSNVGRRQQELHTKLGSRLHERKRLEEATKQASVEVAALRASVNDAIAGRETGARDLIKALRRSEASGRLIRTLWHRLGVSDDVEQGKLLSEELHGTLSDAEALRRSPWNRRGRVVLAIAAALIVAGGLAVAAVPAARDLVVWFGGVVALVSTAGVAALGRARAGLRALRELGDGLRATVPEEIAEEVEVLRQAEARQRIAQAQLDEVVSHVSELGRELAELSPGRRLYTFLAERANGEDYRANLGLISVIRKDFDELVTLMKESRTEAREKGDTTDPPVDRIVLYIDDLDRCEPRQVVDVLQAVHLLLALELFVVVVGVDPRWLVRSLCSHFDEILHSEAESRSAGGWSVTPEDYLEKILNIPLVLPGMADGNLARLLRSMIGDIPATDQTTPAQDPGPFERKVPVSRPEPAKPSDASIEEGSEVDVMRRPAATAVVPRPLTEPEIDLLSALDPLVDTPREAKRLFNLYRMVRATRDLSEASQFLGDGTHPGDHQAVVVLLGLLTAHARLLGQVLDTPPDTDAGTAGGLIHRHPDTGWNAFVEDIEPRPSGNGWTNRIVGAVPAVDLAQWFRLNRGLLRASAKVTLPNVSTFQRWVPRIRRFSYVLSAHAGAGSTQEVPEFDLP